MYFVLMCWISKKEIIILIWMKHFFDSRVNPFPKQYLVFYMSAEEAV